LNDRGELPIFRPRFGKRDHRASARQSSLRNVVLALEAGKRRGAVTVAFTGNGGGRVAEIADLSLVGPDGYAAIVQEVHQVMAHIVCDLVEQRLIFEGGIR